MSKINPNANIFVSEKMDEEDNVLGVPAPVLQPPVVQPKHRPKTQINEMLLQADAPVQVMMAVNENQTGHVQPQTQALKL